MIHAYDELYLEKAQTALGGMLEYAVNDIGYRIEDFWTLFLSSIICSSFENGDCSILVGHSGIELVYEVLGGKQNNVQPSNKDTRSEEYWTGWALTYFQWLYALPFREITAFIPIEEIRAMYMPFHEMDIRQFCDRMSKLYLERRKETNLKRRRKQLGYSQSALAAVTGIPVRTIQQYEQGQKDINKASAEYVIRLSKALYCEAQALLEPIRQSKNKTVPRV